MHSCADRQGMGPETRPGHWSDPHARKDPAHHTVDTLKNAANGSLAEATTYLVTSVLAMFAGLAVEFWYHTIPALFLMWLSAVVFTLGIIEYRRSQEPHGAYHGPEP